MKAPLCTCMNEIILLSTRMNENMFVFSFTVRVIPGCTTALVQLGLGRREIRACGSGFRLTDMERVCNISDGFKGIPAEFISHLLNVKQSLPQMQIATARARAMERH